MRVYALKNYNSPYSSSGGAFPAIVEAYTKCINSHNLIIYGAAFSDDFDVKHTRVSYEDGYKKLLESKYAQSNIAGLFKTISADLSNGQYVVFVGTPCQVDGLNRHLEHEKVDKSKLLTIDLICHGTPSNAFWNRYIEYIKQNNKGIKRISFRNKSPKRKSGLVYVMEDGSVKSKPSELYIYMRFFSRNLSLNKGCFQCKHRNEQLKRPGDFTIGDFWGVSECVPTFKKIEGVNLVLPNSNKANELMKLLWHEDNVIIDECKDNKWLIFNPHLHVQTKLPKGYDAFWEDYKNLDWNEFIDKWSRESYKSRVKIFLSSVSDKLGIKYKLKLLRSQMRIHKGV